VNGYGSNDGAGDDIDDFRRGNYVLNGCVTNNSRISVVTAPVEILSVTAPVEVLSVTATVLSVTATV